MPEDTQTTISPEYYPKGFAAWLQPLWDARQRFVSSWSAQERSVLLAILRCFTELSRGPFLADLLELVDISEKETLDILRRFNKKDALKYDEKTTKVLAFYPFSDIPCAHEVVFPSGKRLWGM